MSEYIDYYICKQDKNTKLIYPLGPFDDKGNFKGVIYKSRSYYTDLSKYFSLIPKEQVTNELTTKIYNMSLEEYFNDGVDDFLSGNGYYMLHYCPLSKLGSCNYIKANYYLIDDIKQYERSQNDDSYEFDGFYEYLSPQLYCELLKNENTSKIKRKPKKDCGGNEIDVYYANDYAFYMYPNYSGKEFEAFILNKVSDMLMPYKTEEYEIVVVFTRD